MNGAIRLGVWCLGILWAAWLQASPWQSGAPLAQGRAGAALVAAQGHLYLLGGVDGHRYLNSVERAPILADGRIGPWQPTTPLPAPRGFADAVVVDGFIYLAGGARGDHGQTLYRSVIRAPILTDGRLGPWRPAPAFQLPRRCAKLVRVADRLVTAGGYGGTLLDSVEVALIDPLGLLADWRLQAQRLTQARYVDAMVAAGRRIFVLGGHDPRSGHGLRSTEWSRLDADGRLHWRSGPPLRHGRYALAAAVLDGWLYALGGFDGQRYLDSVERAPLRRGGLGPFEEATPLPEPLAGAAVTVAAGRLYLVGGSNGRSYRRATYTFSPSAQGD